MQGWNNLTNGAHLLANALLVRQDVVTTKTTVPIVRTVTTTTISMIVSKISTTSTTLLNNTTIVNDTSLSTTLRSTAQQSTTIDSMSISSEVHTSSIKSMHSFTAPLSTIIATVVGVLLLMMVVGLMLIVALKCRKTSSNVNTEIAINGMCLFLIILIVFSNRKSVCRYQSS